MNAAVNALELQLATLENNEPINRKEGNIEQADSQLEQIKEIREAIEKLQCKIEVKGRGRSIHISSEGVKIS